MTPSVPSSAPSTVPLTPEETQHSTPVTLAPEAEVPAVTPPTDSYVKLAMRNMVRKRGLSLVHFSLTTIGLLAFLVGISYLTR
ncbi:DUF3285 domain-containing protein [Trichothermofontia sp.]